jgi:alpha-L-rhamnosidase
MCGAFYIFRDDMFPEKPDMSQFRTFLLFYIPQIPEGVTWAKTSQMTPYGMIEVNWELFETRMQLDVKVPVGATGILQIPEYTSEVIVNSEIIFSRSLGVSNPVDQFELSSGNHTIEFRF